MVVAPSSTVDMATPSGDLIEIEERDPAELHASAAAHGGRRHRRLESRCSTCTPHALIGCDRDGAGRDPPSRRGSMREAFGA
jgi:methylthioribose-1-phosphate isomerase